MTARIVVSHISRRALAGRSDRLSTLIDASSGNIVLFPTSSIVIPIEKPCIARASSIIDVVCAQTILINLLRVFFTISRIT